MRLLKSTLLIIFLGLTSVLSAQNIQDMNFENIRVDQLSEQQIQKINEEAQARDLSIEQIQQLAVARGMSESEAQKLGRKLRTARSSIGGREDSSISGRLRYAPTDTTRAKFFDSFFGGDSQRDSLEFYRTLERIKYESQRDSVKLAKTKLQNKIFGMNLFSNRKSTFEPALNIPTPENYQLGPGDELIVDIWGAAQGNYQLQVSPEGTVIIDRLGPIYVNGITIEEAKKRLREKLGELYSGLNPQNEANRDTYFQVTLGQVRSIQVTVLGEARVPGNYTLPSLATVFNALYSAGGPTVDGSFRKIDIIRGDSIITTFDLYNLLVNGNQKNNIRLKDQDIIKINPYLNRITVNGEVKRPGIYETKDQETLDDVLKFTGGFTGKAYKNRIKIIGNTSKEKRIDDVSIQNFDQYVMSNGDSVTVGKVLDRYENLVEIQGAVFREGRYALTDSTTITSLIERADGLRGDVFSNRGLIYREQPDYTLKAIPFNVSAVINNPAENDIALQKNDLVIISSIFDLRQEYFVDIAGPVQKPDQYKYAEEMTLEDLIFQAGGFREEAAPYQIEVARRIQNLDSRELSPDIANIYTFEVDADLQLDEEDANFTLHPFDKVYIRKLPNYEKQKEVKIVGEVKYPGTYTISSKSDRISDIIQRAGGLTNESYLQGATLFRKKKFTEQESQQQVANVEGLSEQELQGQLEDQGSSKNRFAQVGINLPDVLRNPNSKFDLFVEEGDSLFIPKQLQTVNVKGGVFYPTTVRFQDNFSYKDYITQAGGFTDLARERRAYVIYANGEVNKVSSFLFFKNFPEIRPRSNLSCT
ncbi:MAG: SLBB domain-containing protein [Balneolaceae bacterium]|nr:SLBB domain-containing protein [Balneolaceae bacterium]